MSCSIRDTSPWDFSIMTLYINLINLIFLSSGNRNLMNGGKKCLKALNQMDFMIWAWMKCLLELELLGEMLPGHSERFYFNFFPFLPYFQELVSTSGALHIVGKTGKTLVLPWFCRIDCSSNTSGTPHWYGAHCGSSGSNDAFV